jgi:periplasmic divalent cation tolerance protein
MTGDCVVVLVTVGKRDEAERIAEAVVAERLAACGNLIPGIRSIYHWQGEICRDEETLLLFKTRSELFERLRARVKELHSYDVPEIISLPILAGHAPYLDWIRDETRA